MGRVLRAGCAVVAVAAVAAVAPGVARAQADTALIGTFTDTDSSLTGPVGGVLSVTSFSAEGRTLVASGSAQVSFCIPDVDPKNCLATFAIPLTLAVAGVSGTCDAIEVTLDPLDAVVGGDRFVLELEAASPLVLTGGSAGARCATARRAASSEPLFTLAASLNRLL